MKKVIFCLINLLLAIGVTAGEPGDYFKSLKTATVETQGKIIFLNKTHSANTCMLRLPIPVKEKKDFVAMVLSFNPSVSLPIGENLAFKLSLK